MLSRIRIGFLAAFIFFFLSSFLTVAQTRPESLPSLDSLTVGDMKAIGMQLFVTTLSMEEMLKAQEPDAERIQTLALNQLALAKLDSTATKIQLDSLNKEAKRATAAYKKLSNLSNKATKLSRFIEPFSQMDSLNLRKNLPKAWKQVSQLYDEVYAPAPTEKAEKEPVTGQTKVQPSSPGNRFTPYNPAADVMLRPPTPPCVIASSSRDEFSGEVSRELARAELFRHTNPALKTYLQGKTHVICEAAMVSVGTKATLLLTFNINDPNARKAFGRLEKNSVATFKFLDGSTFELQNAVADDGVFTPENEASIFRAQYPLSPEALKKIRNTELDKLRILWSKGYDDYDIQQVDLLIRQADCLFK